MTFPRLFLLALLQIAIIPLQTTAQDTEVTEVVFEPKKLYFSNCFDGALLTTASHSGPLPLNATRPVTVGTPRFTYFWNTGVHLNYDFNNHIGIFTGLGIKNLGFIEKSATLDSTVKRRVYTIGLPVGIKLGNMKKKTYGFIGGGIDLPFNYREKGFIRRGKKDKFNEWFSDRTAATMPYAFAGISMKPGIYFKVQYYPGNFMNPDYSEPAVTGTGTPITIKPYAMYDIQILMFSVGFDIRYSNKMKIKAKGAKDNMM